MHVLLVQTLRRERDAPDSAQQVFHRRCRSLCGPWRRQASGAAAPLSLPAPHPSSWDQARSEMSDNRWRVNEWVDVSIQEGTIWDYLLFMCGSGFEKCWKCSVLFHLFYRIEPETHFIRLFTLFAPTSCSKAFFCVCVCVRQNLINNRKIGSNLIKSNPVFLNTANKVKSPAAITESNNF